MDKQEWYSLTPAAREKLVLELLSQGYTADQLNDYFDVKTERVILDFMNRRGYKKRNNTYIPKQQTEELIAPQHQKQIDIENEKIKEDNKRLLEKQQELINNINEYKLKDTKQQEQIDKMLDIIRDYQVKEESTQNQLVSMINNDRSQSERVMSIIEHYMAQVEELKTIQNKKYLINTESNQDLDNKPTSYIEVVDTSLPIPKSEGEVKRTTIRVNENIMSNFNKTWKEKYSEYKQHDLLNLALQMFIDKYK